MGHEPIILDAENWSDAHAMVQYNLNRCVNNIHDLRNEINERLLFIASQREADISKFLVQRETDLTRISDRLSAIGDRLTSVETRAAIYGAVGGFLAGGAMTALITFLFRK